MDIVVPAMALCQSQPATKAFLVLSQVLVASGAVALEMVVKGRHDFAGSTAALTL
jgi:hypothetical protein